jgi:hypothetical protein
MPLHLIKLCVGCDNVKELEDWIRTRLRDKRKQGLKPEHIHTTRMTPKRAAELTDGGSLFWIIRGEVLCRQRMRDLRSVVDDQGIARCQIVLEPKVIPVQPRFWRPFQGWRYLEAKDAPPDLDRSAPGAREMPEPMRRELHELGLL